jgi:type VI secretion system protein VasG
MEISRVALFGKLNRLAYQAIESATMFCKMRGNPYVELAHWFHQILQLPNSDLHGIIRHFQLDPARLAKDLTESLDRLPRGASSISDLSSHIEEAVERGWVYATLLFGDSQIRTGYLMVGILSTRGLNHELMAMSQEFQKIRLHELSESFAKITAGSPEDRQAATDGTQLGQGPASDAAGGGVAPAAMGKQEALQKYSVDLTEMARAGQIDPIIGRDEEIRRIVDILMRRRQNNPILTGEAGVGKTAVVEGFALRVASGDVPPPLRNVSVRALDVGALQAGASMKGEFESRLKQVIEEVQSSEQPIILFIDEAHTLIGAGGAAGTGDAANLLKPALARGQLRTIAATTWAEYKKHIEADPALTRRFQMIQVTEPSEEQAVLMMRSMASTLEKHHRVQVLDEALEAAVHLSHRYVPARQLPDKAVSLLDTAAARVAISQHAVPAAVDDSRRTLQALETELRIIANERAVGIDTQQREEAARSKLAAEQARLSELESKWEQENKLVQRILELRAALRGSLAKVEGTASDLESQADEEAKHVAVEHGPRADAAEPPQPEEERATLLNELAQLQQELAELQGESPLILPSVDRHAVAAIVAEWTGIPVGRMVKDEMQTVLNLADALNQRVIGQKHALEMIARRIQTSRAGLDDPNKPIGVFLLCGPSGVGKTETALALAETLYGGDHNVITINMSEFQEAHTVSTLKGAPPGYVGYGEGGVLTEAVRRRPYSVVLLDEVEKAHSDVHEIFFQVFDKGRMEDGEGRLIDFKNTLILLTSNVGSDLIMNMCKDPELVPSVEGIAKALRNPLLQTFPAALLGRLVTIPYYPLTDEMIRRIARLQLERIRRRIELSHDVPFSYSDDVVDLIAARSTELESGGRMIDAILTNTLLPAISREFLQRMMQAAPVHGVRVSAQDGEFHYEFDA